MAVQHPRLSGLRFSFATLLREGNGRSLPHGGDALCNTDSSGRSKAKVAPARAEDADAVWRVSIWGNGKRSEEKDAQAESNIGLIQSPEHPCLKDQMLLHSEMLVHSEIYILQASILCSMHTWKHSKLARTFFCPEIRHSRQALRKSTSCKYATSSQDINLCICDNSWMVSLNFSST